MGRGKGGRASGSRRDGLFLDYDFEIFTQDDNGQLRTPENNSTFVGAIEDFELNIQGSNFDFDNDIEPTTNNIDGQELIGDSFNIPIIGSLDLKASAEGSQLFYSISSPGSELTSFGIERFIIGVDIGGEATLPNGGALDINQATTNIEYIIDNELLELSTDNFDNQIIIEARLEGSTSTELIESSNIQSSNFEPISREGGISLPDFDIFDGDRGNLNDLVDFFGGENGNDSSFL